MGPRAPAIIWAVLPYIYMCVIPLLQCPETVGDLLLNYSVEYII